MSPKTCADCDKVVSYLGPWCTLKNKSIPTLGELPEWCPKKEETMEEYRTKELQGSPEPGDLVYYRDFDSEPWRRDGTFLDYCKHSQIGKYVVETEGGETNHWRQVRPAKSLPKPLEKGELCVVSSVSQEGPWSMPHRKYLCELEGTHWVKIDKATLATGWKFVRRLTPDELAEYKK